MAKQIPGYLKLHTEDQTAAKSRDDADLAVLQQACSTFVQLTGYELNWSGSVQQRRDVTWSQNIPCGRGEGTLALGKPPETATPQTEDAVKQHAAAIGGLLSDLLTTRQAIRQREAELATGIPVALRSDDSEHLSDRLEAVLKGGAEAVGCQAAALYLLDDATSQLKLRAAFGLPSTRLVEPARPLRGSVADLEALVGHAVVLEDAAMLPHWKVPEDFASAVCVPVATASTPLGTLWFFCDHVRDFSAEETNLIEIIAGRLVSDLEREILRHEGVQSQQLNCNLHDAAQWQLDRLPQLTPLVDGWEMAGWCSPAGWIGGDFYTWSVAEDGRLAFTVGAADGGMIEAGLTAASVQSAVHAHGQYAPEPNKLLERVNESLWTLTAGPQAVSLLSARIDPERGTLSFSWAGAINAILLSSKKPRELCGERPALGLDPDMSLQLQTQALKPGDALIICSRGIAAASQVLDQPFSTESIASAVGNRSGATAETILDRVRTAFPMPHAEPLTTDRTILVIHRRRG